MPNQELVRTILASRGFEPLNIDRAKDDARELAEDIQRDFQVTPRPEKLLAVGGPKHGEKLSIPRHDTRVFVVERLDTGSIRQVYSGPQALRYLEDELYRQHEYARHTIVTGGDSRRRVDVLVHARGPF